MISIRKEHNEKIFSGVKKWEGRKTLPKCVKVANYIDPTSTYNKSASDVRFYIYEPKTGGGCGKVVGEFTCDFAQVFLRTGLCFPDFEVIAKALCVSVDFAKKYFDGKRGYMIRVCAPKKYDEPKELSAFEYACDDSQFCPTCRYHIPGTFTCDHTISKAPQSWCYVEEL